jgi:hypothetical protein
MTAKDADFKIETIPDYCPVDPDFHAASPIQYLRDCVSNSGHEVRSIPEACAQDLGKRIEWTGAGGSCFLGIVVDQADTVISEFWGTRKGIRAWMETSWPHLRAHYVPMVHSSNVARRGKPRLRSKSQGGRGARRNARGAMAACAGW